ncbi:MAG: bifunctional isocitrate dehydrogenase kinase/phosphatase [Planctomycetes bacterium]|nr:bifunctional isocitrate dehydrogenase kinase/phosphatase [Planctomycetota bacterium]
MRPLVSLARTGAQAILAAYESYRREFQRITAQARTRFEKRDWQGGQRDAAERLALYQTFVETVVAELEQLLGEQLKDAVAWRTMKADFSEAVTGISDVELAETFFNSVTRRVFASVGVDPDMEFVDLDIRRDRYGPGSTIHRRHARRSRTRDMVIEALSPHAFSAPFRDLEGDADWVAAEMDAAWEGAGKRFPIDALDLIEAVFYRGSGAYLVGRLRGGDATLPLVLVLLHADEGLEVDAALLTEREVSIVFSFTRSHFLVAVEHPADVVRFLHSIIPKKPLAELYISLGFPKHGKTEMYRDLLGHMQRSMDLFDHARGEVGMVMIVFDMRSYDYVFKVIRDRFAEPKTNTRADVERRYRLVFQHDRAGRLIEAQEFEHLTFERRRFSPALLEELATGATRSVTVAGEEVHIRHLYVERRVQPLNLFLREASAEAAARVVVDYGQAIRDLATTNIFPGDLLLKNFGVTRHGRVTFYDYDELSLVTECEFRDLPATQDPDEEMAAEPWFYVGEHDVFPEEFLPFLGLRDELRRVFLEAHGEILTAAFWRKLKDRHSAGEVLDVLPYPAAKRLGRR